MRQTLEVPLGFVSFLRELDGRVPAPVLCVDAAGRIHAAALPDGAIEGALLEGRSLVSLLAAAPDAEASLFEELRQRGSAVVALDRSLESGLGSTRGYAILVEHAATDEPTPTHPELLPEIIDASPDPMLVVDTELRLSQVNAACRELLGGLQEAIRGEPLRALFHDPDEGRRFEQQLRRKAGGPGRLRLSGGDGRIYEVEALVRGVFGGGSEPLSWVVFLRDPAELGARSRVDELEQCIHSLAHDLRGPLCSVRGFAGLLERDLGDDLGETARDYLAQIRKGVDRMGDLLESLLDLAHQRQHVGAPGLLAPLDVLHQLSAELKPELEERGIRLVLPADGPSMLADATRFYQVASNLISNAIQHMGSVDEPEIRVELKSRAEGTELVVVDNGRGIEPEHHERIFELFESLGSEPQPGRSGLGLSIVKRIMEAHGGSVEIDSQVGRGSVFRALFPHPR